ncbi:MAG: NAD(P)/FAD-dependent oxidoreductase [Bacteroidetes bacterium]|jgi:predicted Rossmann fold flavoprotein|nr:NAD(P)/FAD-dependent oxidoreductase [Bacteroidota bacterium]
MREKLVVIGGGAAGFFCAINAARLNPNLDVCILEKSNKLLAKVKVSGGGRCNTTHACFELPALVQKYPRGQNFLKKTFHWFNTTDTIEWFASRGVDLKTEADGRMFPASNDSQTIIDCLLKEADKYKVHVQIQTAVEKITVNNAGIFLVQTTNKTIEANYVCVATGGFPKAHQFEFITNLGHTIEAPVPSLFTFNMPGNPITELMGVSVSEAQVKIAGSKIMATGPLLITHWGMSGPAILKCSAWGARELANLGYAFTIRVNWIPTYAEQDLRTAWPLIRSEQGNAKIGGRNPFELPGRLWLHLLEVCGIDTGISWATLTAAAQNKLITALTAFECKVSGKTTFKDEFVTCGGIKLSEIDANTMQSKRIKGLYFAGEIMDIDGITGGFNFQNAWTSGWIAAKSIAEPKKND